MAENFNRLSRVHERYRQTDRQTDGRPMTNSEHELEFTFANKMVTILIRNVDFVVFQYWNFFYKKMTFKFYKVV